jgi:MFS family permease
MSLIARALPKQKRTMGVSMHSLVRRIPMALGPLAGGLFIMHWGRVQGVRYAFVAATVFALIAIALQQALIEDDREARRTAHELGKQATAACCAAWHRCLCCSSRHPDPLL